MKKPLLPVALTAALGLFGAVIAAVATGLPNWSRYRLLTSSVQQTMGLWDFNNNTYCYGWVLATAAMIICTACFFFLGFIGATLVLVSKFPWRTKPLRFLVALFAILCFTCSILAVVFWICFHEWNKCWFEGQDLDVNATYAYQKYDASWILATIACGLAMLMCLTACWAIGATPKAPPPTPKPKEPEPEREYPIWPVYEYVQSYPAPMPQPTTVYPTTTYTLVSSPRTTPIYPTVTRPTIA